MPSKRLRPKENDKESGSDTQSTSNADALSSCQDDEVWFRRSNRHKAPSWISAIAIFGDSGASVVISLFLLILSVLVALRINGDEAVVADLPPFSTYESLGPIVPTMTIPPRIHKVLTTSSTGSIGVADVTDEMRIELERDGVICVRGLISTNLLERLDAETNVFVDEQLARDRGRQRRGTQFHTVAHSAIFRSTGEMSPSAHDDNVILPPSEEDNLNSPRKPSALMEVSLWSPVPAFAAALLNVTSIPGTATSSNLLQDQPRTDDSVEALRLIRDIFLAKDDDTYVCGWHVDDMGFWPATPESPGINAWIALDDMEVTETMGGFALAVQSHTAPWKDAAYYWTGASTNFPDGGYHNASHMFAHRTGQGTCNLEKAAPHLHRRMEETKRIYRVKRGDVIFHKRWLFHRTVAVSLPPVERRIYRRYSVRFGPGSSTIIPPGFGTELSVLWDDANGGRSADSVCESDGPWYPQAWPPMTGETESRFWKDLECLVREKLPIAEKRRDQRKQEMKPFLKRMAKEQHRLSTYGQ